MFEKLITDLLDMQDFYIKSKRYLFQFFHENFL